LQLHVARRPATASYDALPFIAVDTTKADTEARIFTPFFDNPSAKTNGGTAPIAIAPAAVFKKSLLTMFFTIVALPSLQNSL
jgi:hypothetical protein